MTTTAIENLKAEMEAAQAQFRDRGKELFKPALAELFAKYPAMKNIAWTQYTPYFNDGDACTFSVNNDVDINGVERYENDEASETNYVKNDAGKYVSVPNERYNPAVKAMYDEAERLIGSIPEDIMEALFGDHAEITADRDGTFTVESYSHD